MSYTDRRLCSSRYTQGLGCEHTCGQVQWVEKKIAGNKEVQELRGQGLGCEVTKNDNKCLSSEPGL